MSDVPSTTALRNLLNVTLEFFSHILFISLVTIPVAPMITVMMMYFIFHIPRISVLRFLLNPIRLSVKVKLKVKLSLCFNSAARHEGVLGSGGIAALIP